MPFPTEALPVLSDCPACYQYLLNKLPSSQSEGLTHERKSCCGYYRTNVALRKAGEEATTAEHNAGYKSSPIPMATPCPRPTAQAGPSSLRTSRVTGNGINDNDVSNLVDGTSDNPSGARKPAERLVVEPGNVLIASDPPSAFELEAKPAKSVRLPNRTPETYIPAPPPPVPTQIAPGGNRQGYPVKLYSPTSISHPPNEKLVYQRPVRAETSNPYSLYPDPSNTRDGDEKANQDQTADLRRPKWLKVSEPSRQELSKSDSANAYSRSSQSRSSATNSSDPEYAPTTAGPWNGQSKSGAYSYHNEVSGRFPHISTSPGWSYMKQSQVKQSLKLSSKFVPQSEDLIDILNSQDPQLPLQEQKKDSIPPARYRNPTVASSSRYGLPSKTAHIYPVPTPVPAPVQAATKTSSEACEKATISKDAQPAQPIRRQKDYCNLSREQYSESKPLSYYYSKYPSSTDSLYQVPRAPFPGPEPAQTLPQHPIPQDQYTMPGTLGKHLAELPADTYRQYHHIMECYANMAKPTKPTITPITLADVQHPYYQQYYDVMRCYQEASAEKPSVPASIAERNAKGKAKMTAAEEYRRFCETMKGYMGDPKGVETPRQAPEKETCPTGQFSNVMREYETVAFKQQQQGRVRGSDAMYSYFAAALNRQRQHQQQQKYKQPIPTPSAITSYSSSDEHDLDTTTTSAPPPTAISTDDQFYSVMRSYTEAERKLMEKHLMQKFVADGGLMDLAKAVPVEKSKDGGIEKRNEVLKKAEDRAPAVKLGKECEKVVDQPLPSPIDIGVGEVEEVEEWQVLGGGEGVCGGVKDAEPIGWFRGGFDEDDVYDADARAEYDFIEEEDYREPDVLERMVI